MTLLTRTLSRLPLLLALLIAGGGLAAQRCDGELTVSSLSISTATDPGGGLLTPGAVDPRWKLINLPPLTGTPPASISPDQAYAINSYRPGGSPWWNTLDLPAPQAGILSVLPVPEFGLNNVNTNQPWRFRREFCVCEDGSVTIAGALQADDHGVLRLYSEASPVSPLATIALSDNSNGPGGSNFKIDAPFSYSTNLPAGVYHLEFELLNTGSTAMGFTLGATVSADDQRFLLGEGEGACSAGVVSIQKIEDRNCDGAVSPGEPPLSGWDFTLTDTTTGSVFTGTTDANGEVIFRTLPYGTYRVAEVIVPPYVPTFPTNGDTLITISEESPIRVVTFGNKRPDACTCISADVSALGDGDDACCYELRLNNDYGPYYDEIIVRGLGTSISLFNSTATYGTATQAGPRIRLPGVVPTGQQLPAFTFCADDLEGAGAVSVEWHFQGEVVCTEEVAISCPDACPGFSVEDRSEDGCCADITFRNTNQQPVQGVKFRIDGGGATFDMPTVVTATGTTLYASTGTSLTVGTANPGGLPSLVDGLVAFCVKEVVDSPQVIIAEYLDIDLRTVICADTLQLHCPVSPVCLIQDMLSPQVDCEEEGYRLRLLFEKADDYIDSVGLIKVVITEPSIDPNVLTFPLAGNLGAGDRITIDTLLPFSDIGEADSLCFFITAHDGPEERLCCFADSLCVPLPVCTDPCDSLRAYLLPVDEDSCCFDVFLDNTLPAGPTAIRQIDLTLIDGPAPAFAGYDLIPRSPGWNPAIENVAGVSYTLTPTGPGLPGGLGQHLFQFCVDETFSTDSTYVQLSYGSEIDTLCTDTLAAFCAGCLTVPTDTVLCGATSDVYAFTFTNNSAFPVNAVSVLETDPATGDQLLNPQTHFLGTTVAPGATYAGFLPVDFIDSNADGEFCFDIVLRLLVEGELPIICCYATHCIEVPDCPPGQEDPCLVQDPQAEPDCPLDYAPVCGCDGLTYINRCFAVAAGLVNWTAGPCDDDPVVDPWDELELSLPEDNRVAAAISRYTDGTGLRWWGYILQQYRASDDSWWAKDDAYTDADEVRLLHDRPVGGEQTYRVLAVSPTGQPVSSAPATVEVPSRRARITLSPNPATDEVLIGSDVAGPARLQLLDGTGSASELGRVTFTGRPVRVPLGRRVPGVYTVLVRLDSGELGLQRIVIH